MPRDMAFRGFDRIDQQVEYLPGDSGRILAVSGQAGLDNLAQADAVKPDLPVKWLDENGRETDADIMDIFRRGL